MKKWLSMLLILCLLTLNGCQPPEQLIYDEPAGEETQEPADRKQDEKTDKDVDTSVEPVAMVLSVEDYWQVEYRAENTVTAELAKMLRGFSYDPDRLCECIGRTRVTIGDEVYHVAPDHIKIKGGQYDLSEEEGAQIRSLVDQITVKENRQPGEWEKAEAMVIHLKGEGIPTYRFTNEDAKELISWAMDRETDGSVRYDPDYVIWIGAYQLQLTLEGEPFLNGTGPLKKKDADQWKRFLERNCMEANRAELSDYYLMDAYITVYGEPSRQYKFKNQDSRSLTITLEHLVYKSGVPGNLKADYRFVTKTGDRYYLDLKKDGAGYLYQRDRDRHAPLNKAQVDRLLGWATPYCLDENEVPYYG